MLFQQVVGILASSITRPRALLRIDSPRASGVATVKPLWQGHNTLKYSTDKKCTSKKETATLGVSMHFKV